MFQVDGNVRVIEGPDNGHKVTKGDYNVDADVIRSRFKSFVKEFSFAAPGADSTSMNTLKYRDKFQQNCAAGFYTLEINRNDLIAHEDFEILDHNLRTKPTEFITICEAALQELYLELVKQEGDDLPSEAPPFQLQLSCDMDLDGTFGTMRPMRIRDLTSDQVENLVVIQGIVTSMKKARHKARKIVLKCSSCENQKTINVGAGFCAAHIPGSCDGNSTRGGGQLERCPPNPFVIVDDLCEYVDEQTLKLQELPEHVPVGEMPRSFDLSVHQYCVDVCTPGTRLTAIGVFCATERAAGDRMAGGNQKGTNTVKYSYVQVVGVMVTQGSSAGSLQITSEEEERFEQMAKDPNIRQHIYDSMAPAICASSKDVVEDVKKAIACLLFGGARKHLPDGTRMRGDINVLLLGDPGTAKSQFLKFAEKAAPVAVYTSGKGSSAAGLTAAIVRDSNGFSLEGGAMVLADGGIVCIDEFDKMRVEDRVAIHEAMEQQTISIAKAGITTMLNTRCSVLAAANPRFGSYDDLSNAADQMDFETTILSRFDMMFLVRDVRDPDRDFALAKHLSSLHKGEVEQEREGPLKIAALRRYISYCRSRCDPRLTPQAAEVLKNHYVSIRKAMREEKSSIPITVRQLEALVRISESLAKMELRDEVDISHVEEALRMFTVSTLDSANRDRGMITLDSYTEQERDALSKAEEQIRRLIARGGRKNKFQLETLLVSTSGIDEKLARQAIFIMIKRKELEERANGTLFRVA